MSKKDKKRNKKHNPNKDMDAQKKVLNDDIHAVKRCVEGVGKVAEVCRNSMQKIDERYACLQFQLIIQDLESILMHIEDLEVNGPKAPHSDVPLSESEISEEEELEDNIGLMAKTNTSADAAVQILNENHAE